MTGVEITSRAIESFTFDSFPIRKIADWHDRGMLNLSPEYQRAGVWNNKERASLIDTIFCGYPLPAVILYERIDSRTHKKVYDAIDGKQRLESILYFMGKLSGEKNRFEAKITNKADGEITTKRVTWKRLSDKSQRDFENYEIPCVIVQGEPSEIQEVFVRLNSTGKKLSRQEIRNAKYIKSKFLLEMRKFAKRTDRMLLRMGVLNENEIVRMKDIELMSELVISVINESVMDKKKLLDQMMTKDGVDMRSVNKAIKIVFNAIRTVERVLPDIAATRFRKLCDFYSIVYWFAIRRDSMAVADRKAQQLAGALLQNFALMADRAYDELKKGKLSEDDGRIVSYVQSVREGGDQKSHRQERDRILSEVLEGVFEEKDSHRLFSDVQRRIVWGAEKTHRCCGCGKKLVWPEFEVDHVRAHSKGGRTDLENAALICKSCNSSKGNRSNPPGRGETGVDDGRTVSGIPFKVSEVVRVCIPEVFRRRMVNRKEYEFLLSKESSKVFKTGGWPVLKLNRGRDGDRYSKLAAGGRSARYYDVQDVEVVYRREKCYLTSQFAPKALAPVIDWLESKGMSRKEVCNLVKKA